MSSTPGFVAAFDLDGTLYSSEPVLGLAYDSAIRAANAEWGSSWPVPTTAQILVHVGRPVREIFARLFPSMPESVRARLAQRVLEDLAARIRAGGGHLFPGALEVLRELRSEGCVPILVSNCRRLYLEAVTTTFGLAPLFDEMHCNEDDPVLGKSGLLARAAAGRSGVMVGDRASDGEAARAAGLAWIGCDFGHVGEEGRIELSGADVVVTSLAEIPGIVGSRRAAGSAAAASSGTP